MSFDAKRAVPPPSEAEHLNMSVLPQFSTIELAQEPLTVTTVVLEYHDGRLVPVLSGD
jgi:hypothetical protein